MSRGRRPTRAELRAQRGTGDRAGIHGVDVDDAGADSWIGRYLCFARSPDEARARIRDAGFHGRRVRAVWSPGSRPPDGVPEDLGPDDDHWYRSRLDDSGWTRWEQLPPGYRHPLQGLAAVDPSVR